MFFSALSTRHSTLDTRPFSFDHPVRPRQHVRRNRQADLLCRFEIDDELELLRLLDRQISWLRAFQNLIDVCGSTAVQVRLVRTVGHEASSVHKLAVWIHRGEPVTHRERSDPAWIVASGEHRGGCHEESTRTLFLYRSERAVKFEQLK